jgi:hypothetical protein
MSDTTAPTAPATIAKPDCWCSYGTEAGEFTRFPTPGCPEHDPANTPPQANAEEDIEPCDICDGPEDECGYCQDGDDGSPDGRCFHCGGYGFVTPHHCCRCGGSPYCDCCPTCKRCIAACGCPIDVQMSDGTVRTLGAANESGVTS